jgi:hypothetical protein
MSRWVTISQIIFASSHLRTSSLHAHSFSHLHIIHLHILTFSLTLSLSLSLSLTHISTYFISVTSSLLMKVIHTLVTILLFALGPSPVLFWFVRKLYCHTFPISEAFLARVTFGKPSGLALLNQPCRLLQNLIPNYQLGAWIQSMEIKYAQIENVPHCRRKCSQRSGALL